MLAIEIHRAIDIPPDQVLTITKQILGNQRGVRLVDQDVDALLRHENLGIVGQIITDMPKPMELIISCKSVSPMDRDSVL